MVSVVRDSPAAIAGIRPNDILIAVDGQQTLDQDPVTIAALLAGAEGSAVTVSWRGRDGRTREAQLVRVMVPPETVFAQRSDDVLVLRISSFSNSTASHMALSVQDALSEPHPVGGIVLDLRDNRGGLLRQAVTAADTFLPAGLVATTVGRDADRRMCGVPPRANWPKTCRSSSWSMAAPPAQRKSSPPPSPIGDAPSWSAVRPSERAWCRRSIRCPTAANFSSPGARRSRRWGGRSRVSAYCRRSAPVLARKL